MQQQVILQTKPSIIPIIATWPLVGIVSACFFFLAARIMNSLAIFQVILSLLGLFFLALGLLRCLAEVIQREFESYTLTENQIIIEHGVFNHDTITITLDMIKATAIQRPLAGQILDYGHIIIRAWKTAAKLYYIPHPQQWIDAIQPHII